MIKLENSDTFKVQSAKSFSLVGLIFYILGTLGWLIPLSIFAGVISYAPFNVNMPGNVGLIIFIIFGAFTALSVGFTVWCWITMDNISKGKYVDARTASLVLGIFGLVLGWVIGGIFMLLTYSELGEILSPNQTPTPQSQPTGRMCTGCGKPIKWDVKFCEHCGKQMG